MSKQFRRLVGLTAVALLATTAIALAGSALKGATYVGRTARSHVSIVLAVARNGRTVRVSVPVLPLYCQGGGPPETQISRPVPIAGNGSFSGSITYQFRHKTSFKAHFSGRFSGRRVNGTLRSEYRSRSCSGSTSFTAISARVL